MDYFKFDGFKTGHGFNSFMGRQPDVFEKQTSFDLGDGLAFGFHINQPAYGAIRADSTGRLELTRKWGQENLRVRASPQWTGNSQRWRYLKLNQPYRFEMDFAMSTRQDDYAGVSWCNVFELWGPFDGKDEGRNPAFEVTLHGGTREWQVRQRGDERKNHSRMYNYVAAEKAPFEEGRCLLEVETLLSIEGKGYTRVWINSEQVMDLENVTNTYNSTPYGDGENLGGVVNCPELYCPDVCVETEPITLWLNSLTVSDGVTKKDKDPFEPKPKPPAPRPTPDPPAFDVADLEDRVIALEKTMAKLREALQ